jgi:hypothetical protein
VAQPNSGNVVHVDATGHLIQSYAIGGNPEWDTVRADGQVFVSNEKGGVIQRVDLTSGHVTTFATDPGTVPLGLNFTSSGTLLVADPNYGVLEYDTNGNLFNIVFDGGALDAQLDPNGNLFVANANFGSIDKFDPNGNFLTSTSIPGVPIGLAVAGVDGVAPPPPNLNNFYSFQLSAGQSATAILNLLRTSTGATEYLLDSQGNRLATGQAGPNSFSQVISNFVAPTSGTYYLQVGGNNVQYNLTVTKNAAFDTEPNNTQATAQALPSSGTALGAVFAPTAVSVGSGLQGLSYSDTSCGCIPPDTNGAVGPTQVVEASNTAIRVYDKASGNILLSQEISQVFNIPAYSDPYILYDDISNRFVFTMLTTNAQGGDGVALAVSKDSNFMDGFLPTQVVDFGSNTLDFPKVGFNADAYVITGNLFTPTGTPLQIVAVDKAQLFAGNFVDYKYQRDSSHFRAEVPAQMHGATPGGPMYLVEEAGYGNGHAARVVTLTNELSNNPTFLDTDIPVNAYGFPPPANQPGFPSSVATNDTTFTHADWRNGMLVTAQSVSEPADGNSTARVRWYEFSTKWTPSLVQEGTINPGPGVSTYYGTAALDANGDIGITYMESSSTEYVSMYVAGRRATDPLGSMGAGTVVAPGTQLGLYFGRAGNYGGISVDPTNGLTFWAANEYEGSDPVYNTFLASFTIPAPHDEDWYSVATNPGDHLRVTLTLPGSPAGAQFVNTLSPIIQLYDSGGNLVASGTTALNYTVPAGKGGSYGIRILSANNTQGEYVLHVQGATGSPVSLGAPVVLAHAAGAAAGYHAVAPVVSRAARQPAAHILPATFGFVPPLSLLGGTAATQPSVNVTAPAVSPTRLIPNSTYASDAIFVFFGRGAGTNAEEDPFLAVAHRLALVSDEAQTESKGTWVS